MIIIIVDCTLRITTFKIRLVVYYRAVIIIHMLLKPDPSTLYCFIFVHTELYSLFISFLSVIFIKLIDIITMLPFKFHI